MSSWAESLWPQLGLISCCWCFVLAVATIDDDGDDDEDDVAISMPDHCPSESRMRIHGTMKVAQFDNKVFVIGLPTQGRCAQMEIIM